MSKVVVLGTAHLASTPGKCSPDKCFREYKYSREICVELQKRLRACGVECYIDYLDDDYLITLSSTGWINRINNEPLKFIIGYPKNWKRKGFKKFPTFELINSDGLMIPNEVNQAAKDCLNSLVENAIDIGENIEKNLYKFQKDISLKSFNITR